jgi:Xaa-Pro aminopeptidase
MRWLTGFAGSAGWLLASKETNYMFMDSRYTEIASETLVRANVKAEIVHVVDHSKLFEEIAKCARGVVVAIDSSATSVATYKAMCAAFGSEPTVVSDPTAQFRRVKTPAELARIEAAATCADTALSTVLSLEWVGMSERELASTIEIEIRRAGAEREAFDTIVASGPNGSKPHHEPGDRLIQEGDSVIIDMGAMIDGYHSDMTRTFFIGAPDPILGTAYEVVRAAQQAGVDAVRAGSSLAGVDTACRGVLAAAGIDHLFVTGTGHGIGLEIHEDPFIGKRSTGEFVVGDTVTVEPGIYCEGVGGIRIEDTVHLEANGPRRLTLTSKDPSCPR